MGKTSELPLVVTELRNAAQSLISAADTLADIFSGSGGTQASDQQKTETPAPTEKPLTLEAVRAVLAEKSRNGHTAEVRALLEKHGAAKLSEIDPAKYPALLAEAEVLGNG
ncbi:DNA ligase [Heliorestis acidaminivorans]|uniref:DNA ligase n=1 Tax=Heliorestis acidaminivorans TaxID=553427 RepID=A0A6I0F4I5_9FIRM|nr:DNA ligase [Heliorestis acidaminivorans]KAB2953742.1 DNA ligase [Heliorestis acidaminivorans]